MWHIWRPKNLRLGLTILLWLISSSLVSAQTEENNQHQVYLPMALHMNNQTSEQQTNPDVSGGHQLPAMPLMIKSDLPIDSKLLEIAQRFRSQTITPASTQLLQKSLADEGITMSQEGKIHVEIVAPEGHPALLPQALQPFDATIGNRGVLHLEAWLPIDRLTDVAEALPQGYFLLRAQKPSPDQVNGEGPGVTNSAAYAINNQRCTGRVIAIIDSGFTGLATVRNNGDAPPANVTTQINFGPADQPFAAGGEHGTGVLETLFDHCPNAQAWRLYKVDAVADLVTAVENARSNGVQIISHSMSWYNRGWADNTGEACQATNIASNAGILFLTSAGNRAESHWQGNFVDTNNNSWHEWINGAGEVIPITVFARSTVRFYLSWNTATNADNDLYLWDAQINSQLASSTTTGNQFEELTWTNPQTTAQTVNLAVRRHTGAAVELEVFMHNGGTWQNHARADNSTTSPSNCTNSATLISVGAVDHNRYGNSSGANVIESYSSRGPTNGGANVPHISGPTNNSTVSNGGSFGGTSAATPNVAGTAAAFWSSVPQYRATSVKQLLQNKALVLKDWGAVGFDRNYGFGGASLYRFQANTIWVDHRVNNTTENDRPFSRLQPAHDRVATGGRVAILAGNYSEPITLNRPATYEAVGGVVRVGANQ